MMKTNNRSFCNLIYDKAVQLDRLAQKAEFATEEMKEIYTLPYLLCKLKHAARENIFHIQNARYGYSGNLYSFDIKLNIEDADVVLRVFENKEKQQARLYLGGFFSCTLHCANGAYLSILKELYSIAANVKVAA